MGDRGSKDQTDGLIHSHTHLINLKEPRIKDMYSHVFSLLRATNIYATIKSETRAK